MTSLGLCYTFNGNSTSPKNATSTGPTSGLQLLFNLDQFDNVVNSTFDTGVKIYSHNQDDLALVDELGFTIGPGQHGLVTLAYSAVDSLTKEEGGACGKTPLRYYPINEPYTSSKCRRECDVRTLLQKCDCINAYMPNNSGQLALCNLTKYVNCLHKNVTDTATKTSCDCINQCTVVDFVPDLSYSQLDSFDNFDTNPQIISWFNAGIETRNRVDEVAMEDITTLVNKVIDVNEMLNKDIHTLTIQQATSVATLVANSVNNLMGTGLKTFKNCLKFLQTFVDVYSNYVEYMIQGLSQPIVNTATQLAEVQLLLLSPTDVTLTSSGIEKIQLFKDQLDHVKQLWSNFKALNESQFALVGFPDLKKFDDQQSSADTFDSNLNVISTILRDIISDCSQICNVSGINCSSSGDGGGCVIRNDTSATSDVQQQGPIVTLDKSSFQTKSNLLYRSLLNTSRDLLQYKKQLDDLVVWLKSAADSMSNVTIPNSLRPSAALLNAFNGNASSLSAWYERYLAANMTKVDFARNVATLSFYTNIQTSVNSITTDLENSVWTPLASIVNEQQKLLANMYFTLLSKFASLQQYLTQSDKKMCTDFLRNISLWRKPSISRQTQELTYSLTATQTWTVWSSSTSLNAFVNGVSGSVITLIVSQVCAQITTYINDARSKIVADLTKLAASSTPLIDELNSYIESIDGGLSRETFIKVDIYYGQLKSEKITQSPAYDIASFFGDLGGFYGLCLGGSVITLFELIDLIIYNSIVKATKKRSRRNDIKQSTEQKMYTMDTLNTVNRPNSDYGDNRDNITNLSGTESDMVKMSKRWRPNYAATNDNDFAL